MTEPTVILVAGVSGSGKTTIGTLLAERLGWEYAEADAFHPEANIAKMRAGHPLTDEDRLPWLRSIAAWIDERVATGRPGVVTSSALKRSYRNLLVDGHAEVRIVLLDGDRDTIAARMRARKGHFFSADLLDSQFADLERPEPDENIVTAPITGTPEETVKHILKALDLSPRSH
ncbi:gluconokinase [Actinomadura madurae]|uniref:gluconokinase n=1 Tax=Actinomadura madurae TaxID=1993 RepID=UPI0020D25283|nr:gluconokinase [Actinomadura madurae]MCP9953662.1 gluconokinase [Actinomadura madurae]MCP9970418.1 gluconokinase [Actinomadura madurae]MCP9982900.1 gluconokinase [Actinomadura madurae]MCQ0005552.1 gluconokinase [Actinomadura madurae]MCQ0019133.1 gluconokinase [Actinomadura madurae]